MRLVISGLLSVTLTAGVLVTGCGSGPPAAKVPPAPSPAGPASTDPGDSVPIAPAGSPAAPPATAALPIGSGQDVRTPELAARITVRPEPAAGDPAYVVRVTVRILRGTWEFGPQLVRLRQADGAENGPIEGGTTPGALTLHDGVTRSWRMPFAPPAGDGAGGRLLVGTPSGAVLAWAIR